MWIELCGGRLAANAESGILNRIVMSKVGLTNMILATSPSRWNGKQERNCAQKSMHVQIEGEGPHHCILRLLSIHRRGMGVNWTDCKCNLLSRSYV